MHIPIPTVKAPLPGSETQKLATGSAIAPLVHRERANHRGALWSTP